MVKQEIKNLLILCIALIIGLVLMACQTAEPILADQNISYEVAMSHVDSLDKGGRWLSQAIGEVNSIEDLSEEDTITINHHLFELISTPNSVQILHIRSSL